MFDMSMGDILLALVIFYVGFRIVILIIHAYLTNKLSKLEDFVKRTMIPVAVEKRDGVFFMYNAVTGEFLCQGNTVNDAGIAFNRRFPSRKGILIKNGDEVIV